MSWKYSDINEWEAVITSEKFPIADVASAYKEWVQTDEYSVLQNTETGELAPFLQSKRGNYKYAKNQQKKVRGITEAVNQCDFSYRPPGYRDNTSCYTRALFLTLTFSRDDFTLPEAWLSLKGKGSSLNLFKANLTKFFRKDLKDTEYRSFSYSSHARKEAHDDGYPHVHMIIILNQPIRAHYHSKSNTWRVDWNRYVLPIKELWSRSINSNSNCDIQAICGSAVTEDKSRKRRNVMSYLMKYVTKAVNVNSDKAVLTHSMLKFFNMRDIFSKQFLEDIQYNTARLDIKDIELKPLTRMLRKIDKEIEQINKQKNSFGYLLSGKPERLIQLHEKRNRIIQRINEIRSSPWKYAGNITFYKDRKGFLKYKERLEVINRETWRRKNIDGYQAVDYDELLKQHEAFSNNFAS